MLLMKLDGSGMVNIDAVGSRLKMSCEYEQEAFTFYAGPRRDVLLGKAARLFRNALEASVPYVFDDSRIN